MDWFKGLKSEEELTRRYKELAKKYHPDKGGDTELMQEISTQFMQAKANLKRSPFERLKITPNEKLQRQMEAAIVVAKAVSPKAEEMFGKVKASPLAKAIVEQVSRDGNQWIADLFAKL